VFPLYRKRNTNKTQSTKGWRVQAKLKIRYTLNRHDDNNVVPCTHAPDSFVLLIT